MCGIIAIIGRQPVAAHLVDALRRLAYRGYDSAGIATLEDGALARVRAPGKLDNLEKALAERHLVGHIGIGHTRWATHGAASIENAHPHTTHCVAVVHNGIIENFKTLKDDLIAQGVNFQSQTDTEVVVQLLSRELGAGCTPQDAMARVLPRLQGAFALAVLFDGRDDILIAARKGAPLAIGYGDGEMFIGSDASALAPFSDQITYLADGDWAVVARDGAIIHDENGSVVDRPRQRSTATAMLADKGAHRHFMDKEIHEQPEVLGHTLAHYVDMAEQRVALPHALPVSFEHIDRLTICACGTAFYAALVAKYWFERYAGLAVDIDIASEFRYRQAPLARGGLAFFISQSGETADTLAALRYCRENGQGIASIVNVVESSIARASDTVMPIHAGPEIGVASTKAFTCQLMALACLAIAAGRTRGHIDERQERHLVGVLMEVPRLAGVALAQEEAIRELAAGLSRARNVLYLGRGVSFPIALEGALKLKELSYIHAEGYAAGELKHGPIALIDESTPVIVIAPYDRLFEKTVSNMQEVAARGGRIVMITDRDGAAAYGEAVAGQVVVPSIDGFASPLLNALPVQQIAYHTAVFLGTDVDQPRNLAKSVTVE